jgi:hypothetical protein
MARVAQNPLEGFRYHGLLALKDLREPFVVMDERARDVVTPVVGNRFNQNILDAVATRVAREVRADPAVVGQTSDDHEGPSRPVGAVLEGLCTRPPNAR